MMKVTCVITVIGQNQLLARSLEEKKLFLSSGHWEVIYVMQELYLRYKVSPPTRILAKEMIKRYGKTRGSSQYLFRLFPGGLIRQAAKISGLPKSVRCL
jgi:tRNA 2-thiouridine synthesizing protein E